VTAIRLRPAIGQPVQMAAGLLLFGIAGYVFVALTGHTLDKAEANLALAFYFLVNVLGPGIFAALEQVVSRASSAALAAGKPLGPALIRCNRAGVGLVVVVLAILLVLSPVMVTATLHGDWVVFLEVLMAPVIAAGLHLVRGLLAGHQRFGGYAGTLAVEGGARLVFSVVLAAAGANGAWVFGLGYLAASVASGIAGLVWLRRGSPIMVTRRFTATANHPPLAKSLAALAMATLFSQLLPNIAPLVVTSRLPADSAVALAFGQAAVIARIPLLVFFPIQTMLLPRLTTAVTRGELGVVARQIRLTLLAIAGLGALGVAVFVPLGPWVLRILFGTTTELGTSILVLLALSTAVLLLASAGQPALVALGRDRVVTAGWAIGSVVTLAVALLPFDAVTMAAAGQLIGPGLTFLVVLLGLRAGLRAEEPG
jgi:O-antigen/teichoic acid export membrane protein